MSSNYILEIKTTENRFYGGSIKANNIDEADEIAFNIMKNLSSEGFENIKDIEAIDYFNFKKSLPIPETMDLYYNMAYYRLDFDGNLSPDFLDKMLRFFERTEEYEKCYSILKKKNKMQFEYEC